MLQSLLIETGRLSRNFAEHACRTKPVFADVLLALVEMGIDVMGIPEFTLKEGNKIVLPPLQHQNKPADLKTLKSGPREHFSYIPEYFPELPDKRTYINTPVNNSENADDETEVSRERAISEKRDIEKAYTRFLAKIGPSFSLFEDDHSDKFLIMDDKSLLSVNRIPAYVPALLGKYSYGIFEDVEQSGENGDIATSSLFSLSTNLNTAKSIDKKKKKVAFTSTPFEESYLYPKNISLPGDVVNSLQECTDSPSASNNIKTEEITLHKGDNNESFTNSHNIEANNNEIDLDIDMSSHVRRVGVDANSVESLMEDNPYVRFYEKHKKAYVPS
ncbi:transcription initiation factor TFIID subunit 8-like isoform X1 [Gordionus sp. m RMFG-2023]|uniref:transcription initiation factor TFIID subunit 8-like isoform X1 n=1 Tax=Gordionus sp. m RMFG-2023 TaxID=3053472 RepID=UPI0031FC8DAD